MSLPPGLAGPVQVALARPVERLPDAGALPGGCRYELKWDGVRAVVARDEAGARVWSRRGTELTPSFPEIAAAATEQLAPGIVLDGELVVWARSRLDFEALLTRIGSGARRAATLAHRQPVSLAAFDVLAADVTDLRARPFDERRALLEDLAATWRPPLNLSPVTDDPAVAAEWFETYAAAGLEGLVIKGGNQPYPAGAYPAGAYPAGGARGWLKFKRRAALDVICGAVTGTRAAPYQVVAGLPISGRLRIVGRTGPLSPAARGALAPWLLAPAGEHP